ncbi:hypothetical protein OCO52_16700 [Achromobacter mucicolens]|uniref:hypothetical protein n=1 Tax=Achromobacter mucicolens TaxID=1389922 RepID=UPI0021D13E5C|nr:hypothetical protein [Achromobacter mucicolens]MCU6618124.1 hypothetical protein [Achromobacter mucicolens]
MPSCHWLRAGVRLELPRLADTVGLAQATRSLFFREFRTVQGLAVHQSIAIILADGGVVLGHVEAVEADLVQGTGIGFGHQRQQRVELLPAWPFAHVGGVVFAHPAKIAHLEGAAFDKDHVVDGGDDLLEQGQALLGRMLVVALFDALGDGDDVSRGQALAVDRGGVTGTQGKRSCHGQ